MMTIWVLGTIFLWGLAFYPIQTQSPEWLTVARNVCFGAFEDGLPDFAGWIILVLGPISFLAVGMTAWPEELKEAFLRTWYSKYGRAIIAVVVIIFAIEANWVTSRIKAAAQFEKFSYTNSSEENLPASYPRANQPAFDFNLVDQSGNKFRLANYKGETILLTFAFAHCQTVCPTLVKQVLNVGNATKDYNVRIAIITLDPWRDTPTSLPYLAKKWQLPENSHILSGAVADVTTALEKLNVAYKRDEKTGDVVHPSLVYVISPSGEIAYMFNNAPNLWLRQAIERIASDGKITTLSR